MSLILVFVYVIFWTHTSASADNFSDYEHKLKLLASDLDAKDQNLELSDPRSLLQRLSRITVEARRNLPLRQFNPIKKKARQLRTKIRELQKNIRKITLAKSKNPETNLESREDVRIPIPALNLLEGMLKGTVTDSEDGSPLQNINVNVYTFSGSLTTWTYTDTNGNYSVMLLPGRYFITTNNTYSYVDELYDNFVCDPNCNVLDGTPVTVDEGSTTQIDFVLDRTGSISGRVFNARIGDPIAGIRVNLYDTDGNLVSADDSDDSGDFLIANLLPGNYFARTFNAHKYSDQLYDHLTCNSSCDPLNGTPITVTSNGNVSEINFELIPWGWISGTVIDSNTQSPLSDAHIEFYEGYYSQYGAQTDSQGRYATQIPEGTYFVTAGHSNYAGELYDDLSCMGCNVTAGTPVTVVDGSTTSGIDFAFEKAGQISGKIFNSATGTPLSAVQVKIFNSYGQWVQANTSYSSGEYIIEGLATGIYFATTINGTYVDEAYDGLICEPTCDPTKATPIAVFANTTTAGIDFGLDQGGTISGSIKDELTNNGMHSYVDLYDSSGNPLYQSAYSDSSGDYSITGLAPGTYFAIASGDAQHVSELYNNIICPGWCDPLTGTPIKVNLGSNTVANFALTEGGSIAGRVREAVTNSPISEVEVDIYDSNGYYVTYGYTDNNGNYVSESKLPPGTYYSVSYTDTYYLDEVYDNIPCPGGACDPTIGTPISVTATETVGGINFTLTEGGSMSGRVTDETTGDPIEDISVDIYDSSGEWIEYGYSYSESSGWYECKLLPPENCYATATDYYSPFFRYIGELYDNFICHTPDDCDVTTGTSIPIQDQSTVYIDFPLNRGGSISGTVTDSNGQPLQWISINVYNSNGGWINHGRTDASGNYKVATLVSGSYYVLSYLNGYVSELYDNVPCPGNECDFTKGKPVSVTYGSETTGINFQIDSCPQVNIVPDALPDGSTETNYDQTILPQGLAPPFNVMLGAGVLPIGLTLSLDGHIFGIPTFPGSYRFSILASNLDYCSGSKTYDVTISGCAPIMVIPSTLPAGIVNLSYSQSISANYGTPPVTFSLTAGELPPGLTLDSSGLLSGSPTLIGSYTFTITASAADGCIGSREYTIDIHSPCLFCDNFDDGVISSDWILLAPEWLEANGLLQGISTQKKAIISAAQGFSPGCSSCSVESSFSSSGGNSNSVWLLGWFQDKNNFVELRMKEETNKFVFKQRVNGMVVKKERGKYDIVPNQLYDVKMNFDGTKFSVFVNGILLMKVANGSSIQPFGTVGFQVKNTTGNFDYILVQ